MSPRPTNPPKNSLVAGVTEAAVISAITKSGYPLQGVVAAKLALSNFHVQEEWSYLDKDTKALRNVDLLAGKMLYDFGLEDVRVRPQLDLIVECKRSDLPFIFFSTRQSAWLADFPVVAGLRTRSITLSTDDSRSTWTNPVLMALGLTDHPFFADATLCSTMSKCVRRSGGELELSGDETYNALVLPLVKAAAYFEAMEAPRPTHLYFDAHLTLPLAVVDAPMVLAKTDGTFVETELKPWVRIVRHDYQEDEDGRHAHRLCALDVVHVDFFDSYMQDHLMPFATEFSSRALRHQHELATGKGFAPGLEADSRTDIESRMTAKSPLLPSRRPKSR
jgi:hypothetical protein